MSGKAIKIVLKFKDYKGKGVLVTAHTTGAEDAPEMLKRTAIPFSYMINQMIESGVRMSGDGFYGTAPNNEIGVQILNASAKNFFRKRRNKKL